MILNTIIQNDYLRALTLLIIIFIILKTLVFGIGKVIHRIVRKTKTNIDDRILSKSNKPLSFILLLIGIRIVLMEIHLEESIISTIFKIISSLLILLIFYLIYIVIKIFMEEIGKRWVSKTKSTLDDNLLRLFHKSLSVIFIIIAVMYTLSFWGIEISPLLAGLGIAGVAVAFALQSTLSNIFGGVSLILDKTIKVGDVIYLDQETRGTVLDVGLRSTKIRTFDNEVVIMPNGKLADMKIQNIVLPEPKTRVVIPFSVAYGSNVDKVKKIVLKELSKIKGIQEDPKPFVRFREMGESALLFKAYFYIDTYQERFRAIDDANTLIYNALNKNNISIPFSQLDVHIKK